MIASLLALVVLAGCVLSPSSNAPTPNTSLSGSAITIASPLSDARYQAGVNVPIQVTIRGADVTRVEVRLDDFLLTTYENTDADNAFSVNQRWVADGDRARTLTVTAIKSDGTSESASTTFTVIGALPTATLTPTDIPTATETDIPTIPPTDAPISTVTPQIILPTQAESDTEPTETPVTLSADNLLDLPLPTVRATGQSVTPDATIEATTAAPAPTASPLPTTPTQQPTATPRSTGVIATFNQGVNIRRGPSTVFSRVGTGAAGQIADVLAMNVSRDWFYVRTAGVYGWVFRDFITIEGEISILPIDPGPATPTLTPTAEPTIPTTQPTINFAAGRITLDPMPPRCNEEMMIRFSVSNTGSRPTPGDMIRVIDARAEDGSVQVDVFTLIPVIPPNGVIEVEIPLTISTWYNEEHDLTLILDPSSRIVETDEDDNQATISYWLDKAACP